MHFSQCVLILGAVSLQTLAINHSPSHQLLSRQTLDCTPYQRSNADNTDLPCGPDGYYVTEGCECCPEGANGFIGCYASNVCSTDSLGASICCPAESPDCGTGLDIGGGNSTDTTTDAITSTSLYDPQTTESLSETGNTTLAETTRVPTTAPAKTTPHSVAAASTTTGSARASATSANAAVGSLSVLGEWKNSIFVMLLALL